MKLLLFGVIPMKKMKGNKIYTKKLMNINVMLVLVVAPVAMAKATAAVIAIAIKINHSEQIEDGE